MIILGKPCVYLFVLFLCFFVPFYDDTHFLYTIYCGQLLVNQSVLGLVLVLL